MRPKVSKGEGLSYGETIVQDVEIGTPEIDDFLSFRVPDKGVLNIPFVRNGPVKDLSSSGDFMNGQRDEGTDLPQCFTYSVSGDAPTDRIEFPY